MWDDWIMTTLPYLHGKRILELGHGTGKLLYQLYKNNNQTIGVDESKQMGQIAKSHLLRNGFTPLIITAAAQNLPIKSNWFDQVVATFPSEYIIDTRTLKEVERVLQPGGELIVLPYAWIKGRKWYKRLAAWVFKTTGQAPEWSNAFDRTFQLMGFDAKVEKVELDSSELPIITATKK
jgi:ubiquinone/menaquinone biosynthesis C-methylase UbiE